MAARGSKVRPRSNAAAILLVLGKLLVVSIALAVGIVAVVSSALYSVLRRRPLPKRRYRKVR